MIVGPILVPFGSAAAAQKERRLVKRAFVKPCCRASESRKPSGVGMTDERLHAQAEMELICD